MARNGKVDLMRRVPLFAKLKGKSLQEVASIADEIDLPKGKEMARQGDRGREGEFFGEIALVTKVPRTASVTASTPVRALVITERDFTALLKRSPEVSKSVVEALGERLASELS